MGCFEIILAGLSAGQRILAGLERVYLLPQWQHAYRGTTTPRVAVSSLPLPKYHHAFIMQSPCRTVPHMHNRQPRDTHLPSSSYSWNSSVKRVHVVVAMSSPLGLGQASLRIKNRPQLGEQERPEYSPRFCAQKKPVMSWNDRLMVE